MSTLRRCLRILTRYHQKIRGLAIVTILVLSISVARGDAASANTSIYIDESDVARVVILINVSKGLNSVDLPVEPVVTTLEVLARNTSLPAIYSDKILYIASPVDSEAVVSYVAYVEYRDSIFTLNLSSYTGLVRLVVSPEIILIIDPRAIVSSYVYPNKTLDLVVKTPIEIRYVSRLSGISTETSTKILSEQRTRGDLFFVAMLLIIVAATLIALVLVVMYLRGKRFSREALERLDKIDLEILGYLEKRGGSAFQSEIQRDLLLPKTSLWRHIRRLEREGYVRIEKIGNQNKIILQRKR